MPFTVSSCNPFSCYFFSKNVHITNVRCILHTIRLFVMLYSVVYKLGTVIYSPLFGCFKYRFARLIKISHFSLWKGELLY